MSEPDHLAKAIKHVEDLLDTEYSTRMSDPEKLQIIVAAIASKRPPDVWGLAGILASERACNIVLKALGAPRLDGRELATVLAALRYWQILGAPIKPGATMSVEKAVEKLVSQINNSGFDPMADDEIDALCERLNQ
jgi:hypothetical protein